MLILLLWLCLCLLWLWLCLLWLWLWLLLLLSLPHGLLASNVAFQGPGKPVVLTGLRGEVSVGRAVSWSKREGLLGGGNSNISYFHPSLGKWSKLTNIFQMGWNHQLDWIGHSIGGNCWNVFVLWNFVARNLSERLLLCTIFGKLRTTHAFVYDYNVATYMYILCGISESWGLGYLEEFKEKKQQKGMHDKKHRYHSLDAKHDD